MDLATLDTKKGAEQSYALEFSHPDTGAKLGCGVMLIGADAEIYQKKLRAFQKKRAQQFIRNRKFALSPEEAEDEQIDLLVVATTGFWEKGEDGQMLSTLTIDGKKLEFSAANARELYVRFMWAREDAQEAVRDRANFLPKSASA